jgi:hypothetical protein
MTYWLYPLLLGVVGTLVLAPPAFGLIVLMAVGLGKLAFPEEFQPGWRAEVIQSLRGRSQ